MTLSLIGAGFGRTGTESMKLALEQLGFGRCHHMTEVLPDPVQFGYWKQAANGKAIDWDTVFEGFGCAIDWPSAFFWRELSAYYPRAKILLTVRNPDDWYNSFSKTILQVIQSREKIHSIAPELVGQRVFEGKAADREHAISVYQRNTAEVQAAFPSERLLTYQIGDGWAPLCAFLDKPIPDRPFPRTNQAEGFHEATDKLREAGKRQNSS